jgi:16S rRNA G966 N2-methylase RsmD
VDGAPSVLKFPSNKSLAELRAALKMEDKNKEFQFVYMDAPIQYEAEQAFLVKEFMTSANQCIIWLKRMDKNGSIFLNYITQQNFIIISKRNYKWRSL